MKYRIILLAILLTLSMSSAFAKDKKEKKPSVKDRVERLEALSEYLLTYSAFTSNNGAGSSADCGLTVEFDFGGGFTATSNAKDTVPSSVSEPVSGELRNHVGDGCDIFWTSTESMEAPVSEPLGYCVSAAQLPATESSRHRTRIAVFVLSMDPLASARVPENLRFSQAN